MAVVQIASNAVNAKIVTDDEDLKVSVSRLLSFVVEGAEYSQAFQSTAWNGTSTFFRYSDGVFPAGFVFLVQTHLTQLGHQVQLVRKPLPGPLGPERPVVDDFPDDPRYDYQPETVDRLVKHGQMIAQIATGGGKSKIAKLAIARLKRKTLFMTTRSVLMHQMKDGFQDAGWRPGVLGDGQWEMSSALNVSMVQTIAERLKHPDPRKPKDAQARQIDRRARTIKFLESVEFLILEEADEVGSDQFYMIANHCRNAVYRLALTATPFMRADTEANMRLMAVSGSIGIQVSEETLIQRGILARPVFKYHTAAERPKGLFRTSSWPKAYKLGIVGNSWRNKTIAWEAYRAASYGLSSMVLVQRKEHGRILKEMLTALSLKVEFIFGEDDEPARKRALGKLRRGELHVLIGSTILDVGVDVPAMGMVILAGGMKAERGLRQRIGRGARAKKTGPNVFFVVDFRDEFNEHLAGHSQTRQHIVMGTPGFAENVLAPGVDFDFASLGFSRAA